METLNAVQTHFAGLGLTDDYFTAVAIGLIAMGVGLSIVIFAEICLNKGTK